MPATNFAKENSFIDESRFEILDSLIDQFIEKQYKQFYIVRAHRFGELIYEYAAGENTKPYGLKQDSITPVFSCTKPITAVLMMKLQEDGLIDVCDPVISYLPWLGSDKEGVLVWHLLTHTSGLIDEDFFKYRSDYCEKEYGLKKPDDADSHEAWDEYHNHVKKKLDCPVMRAEMMWTAVSLNDLRSQNHHMKSCHMA